MDESAEPVSTLDDGRTWVQDSQLRDLRIGITTTRSDFAIAGLVPA